ncbi:MAG: hypothetical protein ACTHKP_16040 [Nitrososphaeraceae archaeon]
MRFFESRFEYIPESSSTPFHATKIVLSSSTAFTAILAEVPTPLILTCPNQSFSDLSRSRAENQILLSSSTPFHAKNIVFHILVTAGAALESILMD